MTWTKQSPVAVGFAGQSPTSVGFAEIGAGNYMTPSYVAIGYVVPQSEVIWGSATDGGNAFTKVSPVAGSWT